MARRARPTFKLLGQLRSVETIARGAGIRELRRLQKAYGRASWRKCKGVARIRLADGREANVELHWYEAHGIGRKETKIKRLVNE